MLIEIIRLEEFNSWLSEQKMKLNAQVEGRLDRISLHGHFGLIRDLGDGLIELKFKNGIRIYFARTAERQITIALGGNKNGQDKDIRKAKRILGLG